MVYEAVGALYRKENTVQVSDSFKKREFVIEMVDGAYTQLVKFQLVQNNCDKLDGLQKMEQIKVTFNLRGREWTDPKTNEPKYFTSLDAWKVEKVGNETAVGNVQVAPMPQPQAASIPDPVGSDNLPF